ncbi:alkylation response protein AidB-like acyl-CoA dehydrogenase [Alkalibacillus filiformis]|uniref:Alkylation response protein AidB-like acyl-CoA dehydrogenase n=1 Tax=Alkalibacillus filiformis TaxID=200990 RepID=A0ABU0DVH0_9BACI|nr:acyl-CoA dehydrogenase family protein [Alkalibacillus filiformis]MDQ0352150.1 alkylation response protein AidB-like acyl-CoA dehydrogenase [Alkalibacillus filiformis]
MGLNDDVFLKNERQVELYKRASKISEQVSENAKVADHEARFLDQTLKVLKRYNYLSIVLPEAYGGEDLNLYEWLLMQEKVAEGDGATALSVGWHLGLLMEIKAEGIWTNAVYEFIATEAAKQKLFNRASTERNTGSPTRGGRPETIAVLEQDQYVINGRKTFTTMAEKLDFALVSAYMPDEEKVSWFLIDMLKEGVSIDRTWDTLGMRGTGSDDLVLKDVSIDLEFHLEQNNKQSLPKAWLLHIPACYLGIAQAAFKEAIVFAKSFQPNSLDHPIAKTHQVRQKLGEMSLLLMRSRHLLFDLARRWDEEEQRDLLANEIAMVKVNVTNDAQRVVDLAMRIAGGRGLSKFFNFERYYRDVRAGLHNPPLDDVVYEQLAALALDE